MLYSVAKTTILKRIDINATDDASGLVDSVFRGVVTDLLMNSDKESDFNGLIAIKEMSVGVDLAIPFKDVDVEFFRMISHSSGIKDGTIYEFKKIRFEEAGKYLMVMTGTMENVFYETPTGLVFISTSEEENIADAVINIKYFKTPKEFVDGDNLLTYFSFRIIKEAIIKTADEVKGLIG